MFSSLLASFLSIIVFVSRINDLNKVDSNFISQTNYLLRSLFVSYLIFNALVAFFDVITTNLQLVFWTFLSIIVSYDIFYMQQTLVCLLVVVLCIVFWMFGIWPRVVYASVLVIDAILVLRKCKLDKGFNE